MKAHSVMGRSDSDECKRSSKNRMHTQKKTADGRPAACKYVRCVSVGSTNKKQRKSEEERKQKEEEVEGTLGVGLAEVEVLV